MGMIHRTFLAYGTRIPDTHPETLEAALADHDTVTHLNAGDYDRNMTFLVIRETLTDLKPGSFRSLVHPDTPSPKHAIWNQQLRAAAAALGEHDVPMPAWLVIPDLS